MSNSALASLTAQYTDSENEDDHREEESIDSQGSYAAQVIIPIPTATQVYTSESATVITLRKRTKRKKSVRRLVSYQDDTIISDAEISSAETESEEETVSATGGITLNNVSDVKQNMSSMEVDGEEAETAKEVLTGQKNQIHSKYAHLGFKMPPEPKGRPIPDLVDKIKHLYGKMENSNMDMNRVIQERKEFRNPSIYEKLIQFCDINEFGTNYPPEIYDPLQWSAESYYEELARIQKNEMLKRQKERKDNDKIEHATALARKVEEEAKKRKSKWDQPAAIKPVVPPALTTTVTGTKGTVISAFGSLPKKVL